MPPDFLSYSGPGDSQLPSNQFSSYQPFSRVGEVVINCFVDEHEYEHLDSLKMKKVSPGAPNGETVYEVPPLHYAWASVQPGMLLLSRKNKKNVWRKYTAAETAIPVIACAACLSVEDEESFYFAGVARSQIVRTPSDGVGPREDEMFTLARGGVIVILNTSRYAITPGQLLEWTLDPLEAQPQIKPRSSNAVEPPRRIGVSPVQIGITDKTFGRALSYAKPGEMIDVHLNYC